MSFFYAALFVARSDNGPRRAVAAGFPALSWAKAGGTSLLVAALAFGALSAACLGLWQVGAGGLRRAEGVFTNPNYLASYLGMALLFFLPWTATRLLDERKGKGSAAVLSALLIVLLAAWGLTQSRGALVAFCTAILLATIYLPSPASH